MAAEVATWFGEGNYTPEHRMSKKTYLEIQAQIESLQREAEATKREEVAGVIGRIKEAIRVYGLTAGDLGLDGRAGKSMRAVPAKAGQAKSGVRYRDDAGHEWSGRGPRPQWLRDALASGRSLEDFVAGSARAVSTTTKKRKTKVAASAKRRAATKAPGRHTPGAIRYRDETGNSWTGMGPKPRWLRAALDAGKQLEAFAV